MLALRGSHRLGPHPIALPGFGCFRWTPVVGALIALIELWVAIAHIADPWISVALATLAGTAAMIGPGRGQSMLGSSVGSTSKPD